MYESEQNGLKWQTGKCKETYLIFNLEMSVIPFGEILLFQTHSVML